MEHRYNAVHHVDSSFKMSSHENNLRMSRRQSVHMVLNDKSFMESILKEQTKDGEKRLKNVNQEEDNIVNKEVNNNNDSSISYAKHHNLMKMSELFVAETEMDRIQRELESIPTHQKPHHHASPGSIQLHLARIKDTERSKPKNSWLNHTVHNHKSHNTVWNKQVHKSEYTKNHVKHPKPRHLQRSLEKRRNVNFDRILKKKYNPSIDSDDVNYYMKVLESTRRAGSNVS